MKKRFVAMGVAALLLLAVVVPGAFAANDDKAVGNQWFNQMFEWHNSWVDQAVKNGQIDQQQAQAWKDHFNYMQDFHSKNGFGMMRGMMGGNGGPGGWGMMGGFQAQPQAPAQLQAQ